MSIDFFFFFFNVFRALTVFATAKETLSVVNIPKICEKIKNYMFIHVCS